MKAPKKSETLEVRLSFDDKQALQAKAAKEGRTVSDVIRGLITDYVKPNKARTALNPLTELFMTLKSKPKTLLACVASSLPILALPFFLATPANAEDISLTLEGEYISPEIINGDNEGKRVRRFSTEVHLGLDQFISLQLSSLKYQTSDTSLYLVAQITEADEQVNIRMTLCETLTPPSNTRYDIKLVDTDTCEGGRVLAQPIITALYGEKAEFRMGDEDGESFRLSAKPKRL